MLQQASSFLPSAADGKTANSFYLSSASSAILLSAAAAACLSACSQACLPATLEASLRQRQQGARAAGGGTAAAAASPQQSLQHARRSAAQEGGSSGLRALRLSNDAACYNTRRLPWLLPLLLLLLLLLLSSVLLCVSNTKMLSMVQKYSPSITGALGVASPASLSAHGRVQQRQRRLPKKSVLVILLLGIPTKQGPRKFKRMVFFTIGG